MKQATIQLGKHLLQVEIPTTSSAREKGLMYRSHLEENKGMLFIFDKKHIPAFWMKNVSIPLSIGFFDENQTLVHIEDMEPQSHLTSNYKVYSSPIPAKYALEVNRGWFKKNKISPPMKFEFCLQE